MSAAVMYKPGCVAREGKREGREQVGASGERLHEEEEEEAQLQQPSRSSQRTAVCGTARAVRSGTAGQGQ